jgi:hypothetical protein
MKTAIRPNSKFASKCYTVIADHDQLSPVTVTQDEVDAAFGPPDVGHSIMFYCDSEITRLYAQFFRERIVYVRNNNVLLLRFAYDDEMGCEYELDLDRIKTERDLLAWVFHLVGKPWMRAERIKVFVIVVADIKGFNIHL